MEEVEVEKKNRRIFTFNLILPPSLSLSLLPCLPSPSLQLPRRRQHPCPARAGPQTGPWSFGERESPVSKNWGRRRKKSKECFSIFVFLHFFLFVSSTSSKNPSSFFFFLLHTKMSWITAAALQLVLTSVTLGALRKSGIIA